MPDCKRPISTLLSKLRNTTIEWLHGLRLFADSRSKILQPVRPSHTLMLGHFGKPMRPPPRARRNMWDRIMIMAVQQYVRDIRRS